MIDSKIKYLWMCGYEVKITPEEVRVFNSEYCEFLDLDKYNTLVKKEHNGEVMSTLESVVIEAVKFLESE